MAAQDSMERTFIEKQIHTTLLDLEQSNEFLTSTFNTEDVREVNQHCNALNEEHNKKEKELTHALTKDSDFVAFEEVRKKHEQEYKLEVLDHLQHKLNLSTNMRDDGQRCKLIAGSFFYYLTRKQKPPQHIYDIFLRDCFLLSNLVHIAKAFTWENLCCWILFDKNRFKLFFKLLNNKTEDLEYILNKHSHLLLNDRSHLIIDNLKAHLPFEKLHRILANLKDDDERTAMFYMQDESPFVNLYTGHIKDLLSLLQTTDSRQQTALHVKPGTVALLLRKLYSPKHRLATLQLISLQDENGKKALEVEHDEFDRTVLAKFVREVETNQYIQYSSHSVLIIYNTKLREGAEDEARSIHMGFSSIEAFYHVKLEKNKTEDEILELIKEQANERYEHTNYQPSAFLVVLLTHGNVGTIDDFEGKRIPLKDIEAAMCEENALQERPKILITQCCQTGTESTATPPYTPTHPHFCAVMSCAPGQPSERGVFISKLTEQLKAKNTESLYKIISRVSKQMEREGHPQTPTMMSTMKAEFELPT